MHIPHVAPDYALTQCRSIEGLARRPLPSRGTSEPDDPWQQWRRLDDRTPDGLYARTVFGSGGSHRPGGTVEEALKRRADTEYQRVQGLARDTPVRAPEPVRGPALGQLHSERNHDALYAMAMAAWQRMYVCGICERRPLKVERYLRDA